MSKLNIILIIIIFFYIFYKMNTFEHFDQIERPKNLLRIIKQDSYNIKHKNKLRPTNFLTT